MSVDNSNKISPIIGIDQKSLDELISLEKEVCRKALDDLGGMDVLINLLGTNPNTGLSEERIILMRSQFGENVFPETPLDSYLTLWIGALSDVTLLILLAAATVSLVIGIIEEGPEHGWIEGGAIFIAVFLVSNISAGNDYSKQLQFVALEKSSAKDERTSVIRSGEINRINPKDLVVGDILVLQAGDQIPADLVIVDNNMVMSSQASLTGEPEDLKKSKAKDFTLYSSCLITQVCYIQNEPIMFLFFFNYYIYYIYIYKKIF